MTMRTRRGQAVIGCNFGDEGKGLITDYLASQSEGKAVVVRFNGGAQAGHTVVAPDGRRHVFSHFGAGSLCGNPTYLSQFFVVNPLLFVRELDALHELSVRPAVTVHHRAILSTPFDMLINQTVEEFRNVSRHGSCGLGINETVTRCLRNPELRTEVADVENIAGLIRKLGRISEEWLPSRFLELGLDANSEQVTRFINQKDRIVAQFVTDVEVFRNKCTITSEYPNAEHAIFEGAQGLMLDEDRIDQWPHVTRSRTGLVNVLYLARKMGMEELKVTYVTRTYLTRHGAGSLLGEAAWSFPDSTNIPNQFQGHLRFAPLDWRQLQDSINMDQAHARRASFSITSGVAATCCDQVPLPAEWKLTVPLQYQSFGNSRDDVSMQGVLRHGKAIKVALAL